MLQGHNFVTWNVKFIAMSITLVTQVISLDKFEIQMVQMLHSMLKKYVLLTPPYSRQTQRKIKRINHKQYFSATRDTKI